MNLFQIFAIVVLAFLVILTLAAVLRGWGTRREGLVWVLVWFATGITVVRPEVTRVVANALGIGRGADLVLYCSVVAMLVGFGMFYVRLRHLRRELTLVVRHLAIREAITTPLETPPSGTPAEDCSPGKNSSDPGGS